MLKRIILILSSAALLLLPACDGVRNEIDIEITSDYNEIIKAINEGNASLAEKLAAIEQAIKDGSLQNKQAVALVQQAIDALKGTLADKLAAVEAAVRSQSTSLEAKIALIDAAVKAGFADETGARDLFKQALDSLGGTMEQKLS